METLRKPLALVLGLMAAVVLLHFVLSPFYEDALDVFAVWDALNWVMALGILIALAVTCVHRRNAGMDAETNVFICVNVAFYAAAVLAVLFFWNWFDNLTAGEDGQSQTRGFFWAIVNTMFVVLLGALGAHLWKNDPR